MINDYYYCVVFGGNRKERPRGNGLALLAVETVGLLGARLGSVDKLKVLGTLDGEHALALALGALELEDDLLGGLGLLAEDGLGLSTETGLFAVVTSLTLGHDGGLASLVLGDLLRGVLLAPLAVRVASLGNRDHPSYTAKL